MGHKVHPKAFKIKEMKDWLSRGFYGRKFPTYLQQNYLIRKYLSEKLPPGTVDDIETERTPTALKVIIKTSRPALIIGRGGKGVEEIRDHLISLIKLAKGNQEGPKCDIKIDILEVRNPWVSASLVAQWVAGQLEKQVPFRRVLKMALSKVKENKEIKGVKIEVAGRLNGVEISRREWLKDGRLPRQTLRAQIDYSLQEAFCSYGVLGVKVWLYKGDKFE